MDRPDSFLTPQVDENENESDTSEKKWHVLYCADRPMNKHKKHPLMDNFEILREKTEDLERRIEMLENQVDKLTSKIRY